MTERLQWAPRPHELGGGFTVRRALPAAACRSVGPFVFFDHFGPVDAGPGDDHDVRPHPHIGLATVTYLFEGAMMHRDSLGVAQRIEPGAINWMTAGRGIVHSERTPDDLRGRSRRSHGLQLWVALPEDAQAGEPGFAHTPAEALPALEVGGARLRLLAGEAFGARSPVRTASPTLFVDVVLSAGDALPLPPAEERAVYGIDRAFTLDGQTVPAHTMVRLAPGEEPLLAAADEGGDTRVALIGGATLGERLVWWNFVARRREAIVQAAADWAAGRFPAVPGETEFIPLPDRPLPPG